MAPDTYELVTNVIAQSAQLLNWDTRERLTQVGAADVASAILRDIWGGVMTALSAGDPSTERRNDLVELLALVRAAEHGIHEDRDNHTAPNFCVVSSALKDLQDVQSMTELVARAPAAASMLGFDRVLLSRIECTTWVPESIHISHDPGWAEEILRAGKEHLRTLDNSLIETQMVQQSRPVLVADTTKHPKLHRAMIDVSQSDSYVAAPLVGRGHVIGFLHADHYVNRQKVSVPDRDLLWMFSDGLGHLVSRTAAIDALRSVQGELNRMATVAGSFSLNHAWSSKRSGGEMPCPPAWAVPASSLWPPDSEPAMDRTLLTRRELQVIQLMGSGHTNAQIARRLVISEGTVKSHVKHILRKLHASNRAEAVSRWLREPPDGDKAVPGGQSKIRGSQRLGVNLPVRGQRDTALARL